MHAKKISIFGSTGSIGRNALEVIRRNREKFHVVGLSCFRNYELLCKQVKEFSVKYIKVKDKEIRDKIIRECKGVKVVDTYREIVEMSDMVLMAESTAEGIEGVITALEKDIKVALATKEILVVYGEYLREHYDEEMDNLIIPVDSEHSAIFQCIQDRKREIERIILTASGGPFFFRDDFDGITVEEALSHPVWNMGKKISIDSSTMMNKALEIIEAYYLFKTENIDVIVHPEGIVHSLVEFKDGALIAQLSVPDMKLPIEYALFFPETGRRLIDRLNLKNKSLNFFEIDREKFKSIDIARYVLKEKGTLPAVMNGADRAAVELFLEGKMEFKDILNVIERTVKKHKKINNPSMEDLREAELWGYHEVRKEME